MQSAPASFADLGDQFLIAYACTSGVEASFASLFNVGHAAELYLKSALLHSSPGVDVSTYKHNVGSLLRDVQIANPTLLPSYVLNDRVADRWVINPKYSDSDMTDPDFMHYNLNIELYWISSHLMDTKYLFASHKGKLARAHITLAICGLNEYWQPFFRELRGFLESEGVVLGNRLNRAVLKRNMPEGGRRYLKAIVE